MCFKTPSREAASQWRSRYPDSRGCLSWRPVLFQINDAMSDWGPCAQGRESSVEEASTQIIVEEQLSRRRNQINPGIAAWFSVVTGSPYSPAPARWAESPNHFRFSILDFRLVDHRITLSALAKTLGEIVNPICFAVLRLITSSNLVGCSTGRSAGLAPFRILSTKYATRR